MDKISTLVFSGCGMKSLCILGIIKFIYIENLQNNIKNVIGCSMGSLLALSFVLKIPIDILETLFIESFKNKELTDIKKEELYNIFTENGIEYSMKYSLLFRKYIKDTYDIDDITFLELSKLTGVNLYISTTNVNTCHNKIFSIDTDPDVSVFDAISASMAIPILAIPVKIKGEYYIDGAFTNNLPMEFFSNQHKNSILGVAVNINNEKINNILEKDNKLSILSYLNRIKTIFELQIHNATMLNHIKDDNVLIVNNIDFTNFVNIKIDNNLIKKYLSIEDIERLSLIGFIEITNYMKNKKYI